MRRAIVTIMMLGLFVASPTMQATQARQATPTGQPVYTIAELPDLGGDASRAFAINNMGSIIGHADDPQGRRRAVLWKDDEIIDLATLGGDHATAQNITDSGLIVGRSTVEPGGSLNDLPTHAFLWKDGQMTDLGTLGGDTSWALAANDAGQVVGASTVPGQVGDDAGTEAFLWENGQMRSLGTLGGAYSIAFSITNDGQVVGEAETATGEIHAFQWANGHMTDLGAITGTRSTAFDMNAAGQTVGLWSKVKDQNRTAMWVGPSGFDLGTQQGNFAYALDINNRGWVVGIQEGETREDQHWKSSFLWISGESWDLRTLIDGEPTWVVDGANGINEAGQIVGYGTLADHTRAFVMRPTFVVDTFHVDLCDGVAAWDAEMEPIMMRFFDALEPSGLLSGDRELTHDEWQAVFDASQEAIAALDAITPPRARKAWQAAQRQLVATIESMARSHLDDGNAAAEPSAATLVTTVIAMDRAIVSAPTCPHP